jgi:4-hydroxy-3-polyprenylbenzoate decarboxylase
LKARREDQMGNAKRIVIGISGASGVIYGIRILELLKKLDEWETHLILTDSGRQNIEIETQFSVDDVAGMSDFYYSNHDMSAPLASGSFITEAMVVIPCTIKTLSGIANSYSDTLIVRSADVHLKEKRKLVLVVRETPLHLGHLSLMYRACEMGALILPPIPSFYHRPGSIQDIIDQTIGKIFDFIGVNHNLFRRWEGKK